MNEKKLKKLFPISSRLEMEDIDYLCFLACERDVSISQQIRDILKEYIKQHKQFLKENHNIDLNNNKEQNHD